MDKVQEFNARQMAQARPRVLRILRLRHAGETWAAIGELLGISRQRAQAIARKAMKRKGRV